MRRFVVPIAVVSILILLGGLTAGLVSAIGPTPPPPTPTAIPPDETVTQTSASDRAALVALYNATDGPNWSKNTNWLGNAPLGEWYGVFTDGNGRVVGLKLYGSGLSGTIPSELGSLTHLGTLVLAGNRLNGEIPAELGGLANLQELSLHGNLLSGGIPSELGRLINLRALYLSTNQLSGEIPEELGDLTNVQGLLLHTNQLSGEIPSELGNLANLQSLWLYSNQLSGEIPEELGDLTNVQGLLLHTNQLSGEIPSELGNLANLQSLWLYSNQLSGEIPEELGDLTNVQGLLLHTNQLSGEIPSELGNLANLQSLWLYSNQLSGEIPEELGDLTNVQGLLLHTNQLSGEIPSELGNLANLQSLWLYSNQLSGEIPEELGNLANLGKLYLYNNQLNGEIPSELGGLANLKSLDLSSNQLSGEIPPELGDLTNVQGLLLHTNQLSGEIPSELGNLANLQSLWLSGNPLKGCIPQSLKNVGSNDLAELSLPFCGAPGTSTAPTPPSPTPTPPPDGGDDGDSLGNRVTDVKVEATPNTPNSVAKWTVQFINGTAGSNDGALDGGTGKDTIKIEFEDDVQFPAAISRNDVTITTSMVWDSNKAETRTVVANPLGVDIIKVSEFEGSAQKTDKPPDETLVTLEVPDMEPADDQPGSQGIAAGALVTVVFRQTAGIKNPTESKPDQVNQAQRAAAVDLNGNFDASLLKPLSGYKVQVATSNNGYFVPAAPAHRAVIPRRIVMSDQDGPRDSTITVVGLGFRNSITATIWNDKNQNGVRDDGEIDLGSALISGSDDFTTTITVNNPPFNYNLDTNGINAVDGRNRTIIPGRRYVLPISGDPMKPAKESIPRYLLESSVRVTPGTAAIGDRVQVTARDFVAGGTISTSTARISIGGVPVTDFESTSVSSTGDATFEMTIPNTVASGTQNLVVKNGSSRIVNTGGARFNMVISGAQLSVTDGDSLGNRVTDVKVEATPNTPNSVAKWTVQFINGDINSHSHDGTDNKDQYDNILGGGTGKDVIMIEFEDDVQFPAAISRNDVTITTSMVWDSNKAETRTVVANPLGVDIIKVSEFEGSAQKTDKPPDETLVTLEVPDMEPADDQPGSQGIAAGALVTVVFRQTAGIKNPTESKPDQVNQAQRAAAVDLNGNFDASLLKPLSGYKVQVATSNNGYFVPAAPAHRAVIPRRIVMSDQDGPRDSTITVVGLGFRNSITATIWNDKNQNGVRDDGEIDLGSALISGSDDFTTTITVNNPPFNYNLDTNGINAVDGRNRTIIPGRRYMGAFTGATFMERIPQYKLESSIKVTPGIAAIGDTVQVAARDFVAGGTISTSTARISIGGVPVTDFESTSVSSTGDATFEMTIPNTVASGTQNLVVKNGSSRIVNTGGARFNMVISGAQLSVTPSTGLVPNQTVTLVGRGFSTGGGALINVDASDATISGDDTDLGPGSEKFNEGDAIEVDNAGNWSSSFVIPITHVTTTPGNHELSITDTGGRSGSVNLNMAERQLTLSPPSGRVGTRVDLEGSGFPADNPGEGGDRTVTVEIQYSVTGDIRTVVTLTPDGSGNISGWFTVPLNAGIPSTNAVRAIFDIPTSGVNVTTSAVHQVPRAGITLDQESGPAGTVVTINGEGFKRYTTVSEINFGTLDVRSGTSLSTDSEGAFETTFLVPVSNTGAQAVTVRVGETIASATFTVTAALTINLSSG